MPKFTINKFKGLRQDIDYPELPLNYCHVSQNINMDDPYGALRVRGGSVKYYNEALTGYPFTSLISAFEYRFEKSSGTVLIVNDNGTLKTMTDAGAPASLTLPTGATMEASFQNYFMGYKDHVIITTGNGATNYMLWYGYLDREIDDGKGLFGNAEEFTGYSLQKAQMITPNGVFSNVYNVVYCGGYYWFSFDNSGYIEKRNTSFQLVERISAVAPVIETGASMEAKTNAPVCLATDGTYVYVGYSWQTIGGSDTDRVGWYKADPAGFSFVDGGTQSGDVQEFVGLCHDGTNLYMATDVGIYTDSIAVANDTLVACLDITCDNTAATGNVYLLYTGVIETRSKDDLTTVDDTNAAKALLKHCVYQDNAPAQSYVYVTSLTSDGIVYKFDDDDLAGGVSQTTNIDEPSALLKILGVDANIRAVSTKYGVIGETDAADIEYPQLIGLTCYQSSTTGTLDAGTYFYKLAIEDLDGQIFTLSDPIIVPNSAGTKLHDLRAICHQDQLTDYMLYRIKNIHVFRAYNTENDAASPGTDYKFLQTLDINSARWQEDADHTLYYYEFADNKAEDVISSTTYFEMSGLLDTVKPRYVNGKYFTWVNDKLHVANFSHDGDTYRNRVIRSPDDQPDNIAFYNYYDFDVGVGEAINGITEMFGRSIVFKERKMGVFYDGRWEKTFEPGIHNSHSFFKVNDVLYYVSLRGIHAFNGAKLVNIHYPVIDLFDALDKDSTPPNVFFIDGRDRLYFSMRDNGVFVYNIKYETWTEYTSALAFYGFFKNYVGDYIGWNSTRFYEIEDNTSVNDKEDYGGGNGTAIAVTYESPLLRFSKDEGDIAIPISHKHRILKDVAVGSTNQIIFTLYEYQDDASGKTSVYTNDIEYPIGSYAAVKPYFFDPLLGESFSVKINGNVLGGNFIYHGLTIEYQTAGYWNGR